MEEAAISVENNNDDSKSSPPSYEESQLRVSLVPPSTSAAPPSSIESTENKDGGKSRRVTIENRVAPEGEVKGPERGNWGNQIEFILTCVSYAVGLGNVWRFPYLCYKNGGGAFLIPYIIMLGLAGLPIFFMELAFGQFASLGPITIWKCCPMMKGLGYGMVTVSWYICIYFAVLISYILFFFFASLTSEVPWSSCNNTWNSVNCAVSRRNASDVAAFSGATPTTPSHEFYYRNVLNLSDEIGDLGAPEWRLTLLLILCWTIVCLGLIKGVQSLGKVSYFTAIFPYFLITVLVIRGSMLDGAIDGIKFYIEPKFEKLLDPQVWADAAVQIFYSLGPCMGTLITMSSFNTFKNNCLRNAITVALINCCTSIYGGFAIFSVVGFMAFQAGVPIAEVASAGPGLAFVVYPEGLAQMPIAPLWSALFFFMMFTIGMGSMLSQLETVISALLDELPVFRTKRKIWKFNVDMSIIFRIGICVFGFFLGIPQVTRGGFYLLNLMDNYVGGINLLILGFFEIVTIMYIYGYDYFAQDIELMLGKKPNIYWKICWKFLTLLALFFIIVFLIIKYVPPTCGDYVYPSWAISMGWLISISSIIWLPLLAMKVYCQRSGMWQQVKEMCHADGDWGPAHEEDRLGRYAGPGFDQEEVDCSTETEREEVLVDLKRRAPIPKQVL